jgi:DNA-binding PadR family transcriptional regulator
MATQDRRRHGNERQRRFFRSGELPLVLLALVARRPQHGYDLMAELDRLFGPHYRPSPGSIYPALSALEAEALIEAAEGDRKTYSLTDLGRAALHARAGLLAELESRTGARLAGSETLQPAIDRFVARVRELAGDVDVEALERFLDETAAGAADLARRKGTR